MLGGAAPQPRPERVRPLKDHGPTVRPATDNSSHRFVHRQPALLVTLMSDHGGVQVGNDLRLLGSGPRTRLAEDLLRRYADPIRTASEVIQNFGVTARVRLAEVAGMLAGRVTSKTKIFEIKIELRQVQPAVVRWVQVPGEITLAGLHEVVQVAMGLDRLAPARVRPRRCPQRAAGSGLRCRRGCRRGTGQAVSPGWAGRPEELHTTSVTGGLTS
jgi:hypothetical protein